MNIALNQISHAYNNKPVLQKLDWKIDEHSAWLLNGVSGIGKTTLLRIIMGLERPDKGSVSGVPCVSAVFQENRLCGWMNPVQNVKLVSNASDGAIEQVLHELLPEDAMLKPCSTLSGGMQRKVAIARALVAASDLIILDEPLTGLDEQSIRTVVNAVYKYRNERTLIIASHIFAEWPFSMQTYTLLPLQERA